MAYTAVSWSYGEVITSTKLQTMADNAADANTRLTRAAQATAPTMSAGWTIAVLDRYIVGGMFTAYGVVNKTTAFVGGEQVLQFPAVAGNRPLNAFGIGAWQGDGGAPGACAVTVENNGALFVWGQTGNNKQLRFWVGWPI